ncbi:MAG TPA: hypothetical protein VK801_06475, partial [Caulobacteraceae bacterium]|nr:hypothetical protein [Caulobacteraceae bacterium]
MGRPSISGANRRRMALALTTILSGGMAHAGVLPKGGTVAAGRATIAASGQGATITQSSQRAIIDWNSFGVSAGAWVQ